MSISAQMAVFTGGMRGNVTVSIDARNFEKAAQSALATGKKRGTVPRLQPVLWGNSFPR